MGSFWDSMENIGEVLDEIGNTIDNVNDTYETSRYGYDKIRESAGKLNSASDEFNKNINLILAYSDEMESCKIRTIIFCILVIAVTIGICIFI